MSNRKPKSDKNVLVGLKYCGSTHTNVNNMALPIYHDVAIVTILDLQYAASQRVGCHGLDEIQMRLLERHSIMNSIFRHEEASQIINLSPSHLVAGSGVRNHINDTALC